MAIAWSGRGALEGTTVRIDGRRYTAWGVTGAPRGAAPDGTEWIISDAEIRRQETERLELGGRMLEHGWNRR